MDTGQVHRSNAANLYPVDGELHVILRDRRVSRRWIRDIDRAAEEATGRQGVASF